MERGLVSITIKVEKITKFKKDYLVFFSKDIVLTLLEDELILYNIYKGKVITHEELREIDSLHIFHKYYFILKKKLLINLLSIEDARKYLKSKDLDNKLIEDIINKLKNDGLLDDYILGLRIKEDCYYKLKGINYYRQSLKNKGIDYHTSKDLIELYNEEDLLENLILYFESFKNSLISLPIKLQNSKISQKMARNGFLEETIRKVLENLEI